MVYRVKFLSIFPYMFTYIFGTKENFDRKYNPFCFLILNLNPVLFHAYAHGVCVYVVSKLKHAYMYVRVCMGGNVQTFACICVCVCVMKDCTGVENSFSRGEL